MSILKQSFIISFFFFLFYFLFKYLGIIDVYKEGNTGIGILISMLWFLASYFLWFIITEKKVTNKLVSVEGEITEFGLNPIKYNYPPGAEFKNCNVIISKDGKEIKLEYLLVPESLVDKLQKVERIITIYYIREYEGGFVFAIRSNGKIKEDIKGVLKAREIAIRSAKDSKDNFTVFERVFGLNNPVGQIGNLVSFIITIVFLVGSWLAIALLHYYFDFNKTLFQTALFVAAIASFSGGYFIEKKLLKNKFERMLKKENFDYVTIEKWLEAS